MPREHREDYIPYTVESITSKQKLWAQFIEGKPLKWVLKKDSWKIILGSIFSWHHDLGSDGYSLKDELSGFFSMSNGLEISSSGSQEGSTTGHDPRDISKAIAKFLSMGKK